MALILAIESDRRQVNQLTAIVRGKLHAELVLGDTAEAALERLGDRVPDLVLTSALLSPRDEQALGERLRRLNGVAAHVQMLTLPVFAPPTSKPSAPARGGMLSALLGDRGQDAAAPEGCDPSMFAEQCREYLERSAVERQAKHEALPAPVLEPDPSPIIAAVAALEQSVPLEEPTRPPVNRAPAEGAADPVAMDIDLSDLLEDAAEEEPAVKTTAADLDDEAPVYELSADTIEIDADVEAAVALTVAPAEESKPAAPEPVEEDFDDWQRVVDALRRESQHVRVPRDRKATEPPAQIAAAPSPTPAPKPVAAPAEPPRRRQPRVSQDEWGMFDPAQAGMAALYARLEQLTEDEEKPARPA